MPSANTPDQRPDLARVELPAIADFIGTQIMPVYNMPNKAGRVYYRAVQAATAAQAGRSAFAAPTVADVTSSNTTYSIVESILDARMDASEVKQCGGLALAQIEMAKIIKRALLLAHDTKVKTILATATGQDILGSMSTAVEAGLAAIQLTRGRKAIIMGYTTFRRLCRYTEITATLLRPNATVSAAMSVRNIDRATLAGILGVDEILVGLDTPWTAGQAWVCTLPPTNNPNGADPILGSTLQYLPDGEQPYEFESFYNTGAVAEYVRGWNWQIPTAFNLSNSVYHLVGIDEQNAVTTSTTTTT